MKKRLLYLVLCVFAVMTANAQITSVALVGEAAGGWPGDAGNPGPADTHQMTSTDGINWTLNAVTVTSAATGGGLKFRANNAWTINWGSANFPSGTGTNNGANILSIAGTYDVTLNSTTGAYTFTGGTPLPVVNLVGTAVTGATVPMSATSPTSFKLDNATLLAGNAQFQIDGVLSGDLAFPMGTAQAGAVSIPVPAGKYTTITIDLGTGAYNFVAAPLIPKIAIVGNGAAGWPNAGDIDPVASTLISTDGITYTGNIHLTVGDIKFRQENAWTNSWGGQTFPSGPLAGQEGTNIAVITAGYYKCVFDRTTGAYTFSFPKIAIVGAGSPGGWPTDPQVDANALTTIDGETYTINSIALTAADIKFRQDNAWAVAWGGLAFPSGPTLGQEGTNITVTTAASYSATFNRATGAYNFSGALATTKFDKSSFSVYPNPTSNSWNFTTSNSVIKNIKIYDILGKQLMNVSAKNDSTSIDASALAKGVYFAKISSDTASETVKLMKN